MEAHIKKVSESGYGQVTPGSLRFGLPRGFVRSEGTPVPRWCALGIVLRAVIDKMEADAVNTVLEGASDMRILESFEPQEAAKVE